MSAEELARRCREIDPAFNEETPPGMVRAQGWDKRQFFAPSEAIFKTRNGDWWLRPEVFQLLARSLTPFEWDWAAREMKATAPRAKPVSSAPRPSLSPSPRPSPSPSPQRAAVADPATGESTAGPPGSVEELGDMDALPSSRATSVATSTADAAPAQAQAARARAEPKGNTLRVVVNNEAEAAPPHGGQPPGGGESTFGPIKFSEDYLADQLSDDLGPDWQYVAELDCWHQWTGQRWAARHDLDLIDRSTESCRFVARAVPEKEHHLARQVSSRKAITAAVFLASARERHRTSLEAFDRNPYYLNTPAGIVDLQQGFIYAHARDELLTRMTACEPAGICDAAGQPLPKPGSLIDMKGEAIRGGIKDTGVGLARLAFERALADAPKFSTFLRDATGGDAELQRYLQRVAGYCLTGDVREHAVFFVHGPGGTGKSVFVSLLLFIMADYAQPAPMDLFLVSRGERHPTELALLHGARLVTASETQEGRPWDEAKLKQLTGGDKITARRIRENFFTFEPRFKLFLAGNFRPTLRSPDEAMRRRMRVIPFKHRPARMDKALIDKLKKEAPAILTWMIEGAVMWWQDGLEPPASVTEATDQYFKAEDVMGRWIEERCNLDLSGQAKTSTAKLYADFKAWAQDCGEWVRPLKQFVQRLEQRGLRRYSDGVERGFRGIELLDPQSTLRLDRGGRRREPQQQSEADGERWESD